MLLEQTTTRDAEAAFEDVEVAVFPVASTEQHGPALPLNTDTMAAETVARGVAERHDTVVLPTLPIGISPHHRQFYGTTWVSDGTFQDFVRETLEHFTIHGVTKMVLVNGHGGNSGAISQVAKDLYRADTAFVVPWSWWKGVGDLPTELLGDEINVPGHAANFEASMMMHLAPELVREDRFKGVTQSEPKESRFDHPDARGFDIIDRTDIGVSGSLDRASAEAGKAFCEASQEALDGLVEWLVELSPAECAPISHK